MNSKTLPKQEASVVQHAALFGSIRWWLGAITSFVVPFVLVGALVTQGAYHLGQQDAHRWSHIVQPVAVSPNLLIVHTALWFIGSGLMAGISGLTLFLIISGGRKR